MTLKQIAAISAAVVSIGGAVAIARPFLQSDPPPYVGQEKLKLLAQSFQTLQQNNAALQAHQSAQDQTLDLIRLEILTDQLRAAKADQAKRQSRALQNEVCNLTDEIDRIRARNKLPPLPPCQ